MRRARTIYFNDARHYYLFVHEPPMRLTEARAPVDEVAGTGIDTFVYGVARDDGLFYPSGQGLRFGDDTARREGFAQAAYWRVWHNMQSLLDRGLDPLGLLVDRAHERGMEFIASLRMGAHPGLPAGLAVAQGGRGMATARVRDFQLGLVRELLAYDTDGVELDFAAAPGGTGWWFPLGEAPELAPLMTTFVRDAAAAARVGPRPQVLGARVYPSAELNRRAGLEVETWLAEGLVDYVVPMLYISFVLDTQMPLAWLVEAAHAADANVYAMLQPYDCDQSRPPGERRPASAPLLRAAAANAWRAGVDGLYTWFLPWPLGPHERAILTELSHPDHLAGRHRRYRARRACPAAAEQDFDYPAPLPLTLDVGRSFQVPLVVGDDLLAADGPRPGAVRLHLGCTDLTTADRLEVRLGGHSLAHQPARRRPLRRIDPYAGQWLDIDLAPPLWPPPGHTQVTLTLKSRPQGLRNSHVVLEDVALDIDYDTYPTEGSA